MSGSRESLSLLKKSHWIIKYRRYRMNKTRPIFTRYYIDVLTKSYWFSGLVISDTWNNIKGLLICKRKGCNIKDEPYTQDDYCIRCNRNAHYYKGTS